MASPRILSQGRLSHANNLVAYCDPHDLIAIATEDIIVYRINGQVAFSIRRKDPESTVTALAWKQDGSLLAVGWSDGTYSLYSGESGRMLSQASVRGDEGEDEEGGPVVTSFKFVKHSPHQVDARLESDLAQLTTEDWADHEGLKGGKLRPAAQAPIEKLARSIATLDVTTVLPRLSAIPAHGLRVGPDGSRFTSQAATDLAFEVRKSTSAGEVDSLLVSCDDGIVHVFIDDTVKIGTWQVSGKPVLQASSLETLGGPLFHVIATNTKRTQTLLAYITQTIRCIQHDYTTGLQFPARLMSGISSDLKDKEEGDLVTNLYHLSMTGQYSEVMLEWLTDIVKETNHKRWHQAIDTMYTNITNHLFINLKPALDRLSIATTELRGQARFHEGTTAFEVEAELFTKMLDDVDSIRIVSQRMLLFVMTEHKQFKAFSKWLRVMVEIGAAGPGTKAAWEVEERENPNIDYPLVWDYIEQTMGASRLDPVLSNAQIAEHFSYEETLEAVAKPDLAGINLPSLSSQLCSDVATALERISGWQGRTISAPVAADAEDADDGPVPGLELNFEPRRYVHGGRKGKEVVVAIGDHQWAAVDLSSKSAAVQDGNSAEGYISDDDAEMTL